MKCETKELLLETSSQSKRAEDNQMAGLSNDAGNGVTAIHHTHIVEGLPCH